VHPGAADSYNRSADDGGEVVRRHIVVAALCAALCIGTTGVAGAAPDIRVD